MRIGYEDADTLITYPRKGLDWAGMRAAGCRDATSPRRGPAPRVMIRCIERARELRLRELSPPETERPGSGDQRRLVVHHDQARLARSRRRPHAGFQRSAALPAHPVAGQERPAQVVRVDAADRRRGRRGSR